MTRNQILPCHFFLRHSRPDRAEWAAHLKGLPKRHRPACISEAIWIGCYATSRMQNLSRPRDAFFRAITRRDHAAV